MSGWRSEKSLINIVVEILWFSSNSTPMYLPKRNENIFHMDLGLCTSY